MSKLLDSSESSDEEVNQINVNSDFAKNYDNWRRKEEIQKLKDKYGTNLDVLSDSDQSFVTGSDDESDDSESEESVGGEEQVFDDNFFKVYSALKNKNPIIYDKNIKFFNETQSKVNSNQEIETKNKEKTMTLTDYHKKLIKEKKGITDEDLQLMNGSHEESVGYYEELNQIKNEFQSILNSDPNDDNSDEELIKGKTQPISAPKEKRPKFLADNNIDTEDSDLKYLKNYWNNEKQLEESERFLRDYIINKRYIDKREEEEELYRKPNKTKDLDNNNYSDDENDVNNGFETMDDINKDKDIDIKISDFHFEETNSLTLKRYPRDIETIRDSTNTEKRALKRSEAKERKKREKEKELKRLRKLKKEELKQRLEKLQEISGNHNIDWNDIDLNVILDEDKDFDSEKYDQKMQSLFGNDYYENENSNTTKPKFDYMPEIDDYECNEDINNYIESQEITNDNKNKKLNKKEKKINKTMKEIGIFEDLIGGDLPTRYKYRSVESNNFGLTDEEILFSDDKELNKWCSIKKMSQYREDNEEKYDIKSYSNKANNLELKRKILKTYYEKQVNGEQKEEDIDSNSEQNNDNNLNINDNKKRKKRRHKKPKFTIESIEKQNSVKEEDNGVIVPKNKNPNKRFRRRKQKQNSVQSPYPGVSLERLKAYGLSNRKIKKIKNKNKQ